MSTGWRIAACVMALAIIGGLGVAEGKPRQEMRSIKLEIKLVAYQQDVWPDPALNTDALSILQMIAVPEQIGTASKSLPKFIKVQYHYDAAEDKKEIEDIKKRGGVFRVSVTRDKACDESVGSMDQGSRVSPMLVIFQGWKRNELPNGLQLPCYVSFSPSMSRVK